MTDWCPESLIRWQKAATLSKISSAVLCQMNGLGSSFRLLIQARIDAASSLTIGGCLARAICWSVRRTRFDEVEPRAEGRGEMHGEAGVADPASAARPAYCSRTPHRGRRRGS